MILFRLLAIATTGFIFLAITAVAFGAFLMASGTPAPCVDRSVDPAPPSTGNLETDWFDVGQQVANGQTIQLQVNEDEATTIAAGYLDAKNVPVSDLRVYFCPDGTAEATGRVGTLGVDSNVLIKGRLNIQGSEPAIEIDEVHAGNFPSFLAKHVVNLLVDQHDARTLPLVQHISAIEYHDGEATVTLSPQ
ncbi:MAG TPA: hypothetical protein VFY10_13920 [Dehalococcoidia bacterium]|nr:hypothetical protein [Dehalococcoidia bacterium]